jgi:hypothetical protein
MRRPEVEARVTSRLAPFAATVDSGDRNLQTLYFDEPRLSPLQDQSITHPRACRRLAMADAKIVDPADHEFRGNSGSQATSLLIRSLALQELEIKDW